ncbi:MAG: glycosyltransferase family 39 protein [Hyphomicrobiaceae bacterium]
MTATTGTPPSPSKLALPSFLTGLRLEYVGALALLGTGLLILFTKNSSFFNFWTDRDMVRSANLLNEFQYMAAELSYGAASRVPGGALHYLWFIPTIFSSDPNLSYKFCVLLCLLAAVPFYLAMRQSFGASAAIVSTAILLATPTTFSTMMRLWNPSFQVPFLFLAFAFLVRLLAAREAGAFKWMIASLVIAMQMHVSTWLLMGALIPVFLILRPSIPRREILLSIGLSLFLLAPYLIGETLNGWENIRTMLASQGKGAVRSFNILRGFLFNLDNSRDIWAWFAMAFGMTDNLPAPPFRTALSWVHNLAFVFAGAFLLLSIAHWLDWGKPIGRALGLELGGASGRVAVAAAIPVFVAFAYTSYSPQLELVVYGNSRYVMFAVPGLAILAGLGAGMVMSMARDRVPAQAAAVAAIALATAMPLWSLASSVRALDSETTPAGRQFMGGFNIVMEDRKWTLEQTVARLSILRHHNAGPDSWRFESIYAIGYELYRYGKVQPFVQTGECVAYLTRGGDVYGEKGMSDAALARSFDQPGINVRILSQRNVGRDHLVVYERPGKPCFTTITNRYVFSPEENVMFKRYGLIAKGGVEATRATLTDPLQRAYIANLGSGIYVMVKLAPKDGKLAVELHSNQLRGDTYNGGFLDIGMIANPRLKLRSSAREPVTIDIMEGLVGGKGTFTPMRNTYELPAGAYEVHFEAEVYPPVPLGTWPVDFTAKTPISIPLEANFSVAK